MKKQIQSLLLISIFLGMSANLLLAIPPNISKTFYNTYLEALENSPFSKNKSFEKRAYIASGTIKEGARQVSPGARDKKSLPPTGYFVNIDQPSINLANQTAVSFTISDAEVGATFNYTFTSDGVGGGGSGGSGGTVSGSGTITATEQQITGIDLTSLDDGTVTLMLTLTSGGETGDPVTDNETKDTVEPEGYTVSIDQNLINSTNEDEVSFTFDNAEVGASYNYTFTSSGGAGSVSNTGFINSLTEQVTGIDLSTLADGIITLSVTLTDIGNNTGDPADDTVTKDATAPTGYTVSIDQNPINASNENEVSFTFAGAEVGSNYDYTFTSSGGGGSVTGSGTINTATDQITNIDLSSLADGTITLTVTLTDTNNNTGDEATDTAIKDTVAPAGYSVTIDQSLIVVANEEAVS
ncbi:hypothetical protein GCM10011506_41470 [Marivirga lumbricoides]|uniref:Cadherin domain-containing protein n=1 Tax=Marivirga lumbricoides TaxID=1046115 RepID=A0ABQ1N206_9BACT|nr:hypothetical protein GCM10011506_41470 [Marivirga lumbricoides]